MKFIIKTIFIGKDYIDEVIKHGVYAVLKWIKHSSVAVDFLKKTLIMASKLNKEVLIADICNILRDTQHSFSHIEDWENIDIGEILHHKDEKDSGNPPIYFANKRKLLLGGLSLLYVEKEVHGEDRDGALKCLRENAGYMKLDMWLIDTYKLIHPPKESSRKLAAVLLVVLQLLLSFFFLIGDWISDIVLCYQYMIIAFNQEDSSRNETCAENDQILPCFDQTHTEVQSTYSIAFCIMLATISVSTLAYIWTAINHSPGDWTNVSDTDNRVITFIKIRFGFILKMLSKILWPLTYLAREFNDKVNLENTEQDNQAVEESKSMWMFIKTLENGLENFLQMFLQLFLMKPYVSFLTTLSVTEIIQLGIGSIFNFSDSLCDGKNVNIALGKLFFSVISLSYGASSRQASKQGITLGQTIKNLVLWLSFFCFSLARTMALFSIMSLESPLPALVGFLLIHLELVSFILYEGSGRCTIQNFFKMDTVRLITSCLASHTVVITFQNKPRGTPSFWTQLKFQSLILCENIALVVFPFVSTELYPSELCFEYSPKIVALVICLWFAGIIFQVNNSRL